MKFPGRRRTFIKNGRLKYEDEQEKKQEDKLKCSFCERILKSKAGKAAHERNCSGNSTGTNK